MPRATSETSAPTWSQKSATMLTNEIFVARNALAACLMSSAVLMLVMRMGHSKSRAYSSRRSARARFESAPMTIRSGCRKSCTAEPSRKNSGLLATSYSGIPPAGRRRARSMPAPVWTGTVLFSTMSLKPSGRPAMLPTASSIWERSVRPSGRAGVPTHRKTMSEHSSISAVDVVNLGRPDCRVDCSSSPSPGSYTIGSPRARRATRSASLSMPTTVWPSAANPTAVTSPT